ncbi:hypothetical protein BVH01_23435, partial [Pseudomonas sp. PA1(2017)]
HSLRPAPNRRPFLAATRLALKREQTLDALFLEVAPENVRAVQFYRRHGFEFLDEWEPIDSHPHILAQSMRWGCK